MQYIDIQQQIMNMRNNDKVHESLYIMHLDANNLYGWAMSQKLPVNSVK